MEQIARTPEVIAGEIIILREQAKAAVLTASLEIGKRLAEAKILVPYGQWGDWLQANVDYSERTAQNLIRIFEEYNRMGRPEAFAELPYSKAVAVLGLPIGERDAFLAENDVEGMSERELKDAIRERNEALEKIKDLQLALDLQLPETEEAKRRTAEAMKAVEKANAARDAAEKNRVRTEKKLTEAEKHAAELKAQLDTAPKEIPATVVEKVPAEIESELNRLRELERRAPNEAVIRFRQTFEDWREKLNLLLACVQDIEKEDAATGARYRGAMREALARAAAEAEG